MDSILPLKNSDKFSILLVGEIITMLLYMVICVYSKLNQLSNQKSNECLAIACPNFIVLSIWGKSLVQVFSKSIRCFLIICHDFFWGLCLLVNIWGLQITLFPHCSVVCCRHTLLRPCGWLLHISTSVGIWGRW